MNLMYYALNNKSLKTSDKSLKYQLDEAKKRLSTEKIKFSDKAKRIGLCQYYLNTLPYIDSGRDVLMKAFEICRVRINWKNLPITDSSQINETLKEQYGWNINVVDKDYTRNNYQNKESFWIVFDKKEKAEKALDFFNIMFRTAIEQDCIDEYKHFKQNPSKRPLTFNALIPNAYDLYDLVDQGLA